MRAWGETSQTNLEAIQGEIDAIEEKTGMTSELRSRSFLNLGMSIFGSLNLDSGLVREKTHGPLADTSWFGR